MDAQHAARQLALGTAQFEQLGVEGELRRGEDIPHHEGALQVGVQAIAAVVRQVQRGAGETARLQGHGQALLEFGIGARIDE